MLTHESATRKDLNSGTNTVLQHRHFAFIAATIKAMPFHPQLRSLHKCMAAEAFADACARSNPRFDRARFLTACGVEE